MIGKHCIPTVCVQDNLAGLPVQIRHKGPQEDIALGQWDMMNRSGNYPMSRTCDNIDPTMQYWVTPTLLQRA